MPLGDQSAQRFGVRFRVVVAARKLRLGRSDGLIERRQRVSLQLRVGVDVGSRCHSVAIGLSDGSLLEEFKIAHTAEGFRAFFARIEACARRHAVRLRWPRDAELQIAAFER
jgi:hypothetical protein